MNSGVHWKMLNWKVLAAGDFYLASVFALPVPEVCQKRPSFWEAMEKALHQASKTAHKALPRGKVLSVLAFPTANKWSLSHLMGNERWFAADYIGPWCKGQYCLANHQLHIFGPQVLWSFTRAQLYCMCPKWPCQQHWYSLVSAKILWSSKKKGKCI